MKKFDFYNVKVIETPTSIEVWEYLEKPIVFAKEREEKKSVSELFENDKDKGINSSEEYNSFKRKQRHYEQMRWEIARIVDCNYDNKTKFITLTFKENIIDVDYTNNELSKFLKRLNYHIYKLKKQKLKYLAVWEKQKRGSIHYHIIFFSLPFIKNKDLKSIWGHGFVKINKIDVDSKDNRGRYVSKYFSKDIDTKDYKKKAFFKSQNLKLPKVIYLKGNNSYNYSNKKVVYQKTYSCKSIDLVNSDYENGLAFDNSTVKYTKIRKE